MSFATPIGLLALLSIPVVLALHLFRRRFRERRVAGLFLFAAEGMASRAGRTRTRLLRTVSLWLELLAGLLLALWLGGLVLGPAAGPTHLVVVLDDSASMGARGPAGDTAERARELVLETLEEMPDGALATVVATGPRPEILAGPRAPRSIVVSALERWRPARTTHDPAPALELGLDLAGEGASLIFVTDRNDPAAPDRYRRVALGEPLANAAVVNARRVPGDPGEERLYVDLAAWSAGPMPTTVTVEVLDVDENGEADGDADGARRVGSREVTIEPGTATRLAWTLPAGDLPLRVGLGPDGLRADDEALLLRPPPRVVGVHLALPGETVAALRLRHALASLAGVRETDDPAKARLVLAAEPGLAAPGATEVVIAASGESRDDWIGPFLLERRRAPGGGRGPALLAGVTLEGVLWSAAPERIPGLPLVLAGETPLVAEEPISGGGVRLRLNLDPMRSNLSASPDWPILLSNLVEAVREALPGPVAVNVRVGDEVAYRFAGETRDVKDLALVDPDGVARPARGFPLLTWEARRTGLHRLVAGEDEIARFAVGFVDPAESDLMRRGAGDVAAAEDAAVVTAGGGGGRTEGRVLALLLLLAIAADWWVLAGPGRRS